ncbi:MAG: cupin [Rhizobacter sp.]|nr:cupin [Rhizobacter sp.]
MAQNHTASGQLASVLPLAAALVNGKTTAILKSQELEVMRIVLLAGKAMAEHWAPGEITLQCIEGAIEFTSPHGVSVMRAGDLIHLCAREPHSLKALEDSSALLTMCLRPGESAAPQNGAPPQASSGG